MKVIRKLKATYEDGTVLDIKIVKQKHPFFWFTKKTLITLGLKIVVENIDIVLRPELHIKIIKHECRHSKQQQGHILILWQLHYKLSKKFAARIEAEAVESETSVFPIINFV